MSDKQKEDKRFVICRYEDKDEAELVRRYLIEQIPLAHDAKPTLESCEHHGRQMFVITVAPSWGRFSAAINNCRTVAKDFINGYRSR